MTLFKTVPTLMATGLGAAALFAATPAHASLNDIYVCERSGEGSLTVLVAAMEPGTAYVYDQTGNDNPQTTIELTGGYEDDGFRFSNGGTVFEGSGFDATLDYERASFICTMPIPQELYDAAMEPRILLDGHGLTILRPDRGIMQRLPFGSTDTQSIAALEPLMGPPSEPTSNQECEVGALEFRDFGGLSLHYQDGAFAGWSLRENVFIPARITLPNGSHLELSGELLPDWMEPYPESTLGDEQYGDGVHAMLSDDEGVITHLWGGAACTFR